MEGLMFEFRQRDVISVAVSFDDNSERLARLGHALAKQTRKKLRLIHVCEPWFGQTYSYPLGFDPTLHEIALSVETNTTEVAAKRLADLAATLGSDVPITTQVVTGQPAAAINADSQLHNVYLTLVGFRGKANRLTPTGWSTVASLLHSADVPVMVIPESAKVDLKEKPFKIAVTDDLSEQSRSCLDFAMSVAANVSEAELVHLHVSGLNADNLKGALQIALSSSRTGIDQSLTPEDIVRDVNRRLSEHMARRSERGMMALKSANGVYCNMVLNGEVNEELNKFVEKSRPQITFFGRHKMFHRAPFFLGRVPFANMINIGSAVVVVPD
jgi:nucleotide-binding universal stress UspA family protein